MSKGSKRRPQQVSDEAFGRAWEKTFARTPPPDHEDFVAARSYGLESLRKRETMLDSDTDV